MTRIATALLLVLAGCSNGTDPGNEPLTGTWVGQPELLGIETLTLTLTAQAATADFTGSGTFTSTTAGAAPGTVTLTGLRVADQLQVTMDVHAASGDFRQVFTGVVETPDQFYLLFPGGPAAVRVTFVRQ
jgi:hypothetical protein